MSIILYFGCGQQSGGGGSTNSNSSPFYITTSNPSQSSTGVASISAITITFNVPVNTSSFDPTKISYGSDHTAGNILNGFSNLTYSWFGFNKTLVISNLFGWNEFYTCFDQPVIHLVDTGAFKDNAGNTLEANNTLVNYTINSSQYFGNFFPTETNTQIHYNVADSSAGGNPVTYEGWVFQSGSFTDATYVYKTAEATKIKLDSYTYSNSWHVGKTQNKIALNYEGTPLTFVIIENPIQIGQSWENIVDLEGHTLTIESILVKKEFINTTLSSSIPAYLINVNYILKDLTSEVIPIMHYWLTYNYGIVKSEFYDFDHLTENLIQYTNEAYSYIRP